MEILRQLIFTPRCLVCARLGVEFCENCIQVLRPFRARELSELTACFCAGDYSGWLRDSIISYKNGETKYGGLLAKILGKTMEKLDLSENLIVIPIPSSPQKIKERGFDSITKLCATAITEKNSLTLDASNLFLRRNVVDQVGLSAVQRLANLDGAFGVRRVINGTVVIVDDVITTGATLNSAARALKYAGAQRIFGLALCGTPKTR